MSGAALDYSLGWRWLLPVGAGDRVGLHGFSVEEEQFLHNAVPFLHWQDHGASVDMLILNAQGSATEYRLVEQVSRVCLLADRVQGKAWRKVLKGQFPRVHEYALLPAGNPRVVVPLSCRGHSVSALSIHSPGRRVAQLGVGLARWLAWSGNYFLLRGKVLLIASRLPAPLPYGALQAGLVERFGTQVTDYALYLGTPDDIRKTVVLPLGGEPLGVIVKVGTSPKARVTLENEAAALAALSASPLARWVPKLQDVVSVDGTFALHQEYRPRRRVRRHVLEAAIVSFLVRLSALGGQWWPLAKVLGSLPDDAEQQLPPDVDMACQSLHRCLGRLADNGLAIWLHRTHGDFAPWNCAWTDLGLFVFDWEASQGQELALGDAFYYVTAPVLLMQSKPRADKTLEAALSLANRVASAAGLTMDGRVYLALWLLRQKDKSGLYGQMIVALARGWR